MSLYNQRDYHKLGKWFTDHLSAMTEENLVNKADIAAELAYRDVKIEELKKILNELYGTMK
jgi:hypothetical protein